MGDSGKRHRQCSGQFWINVTLARYGAFIFSIKNYVAFERLKQWQEGIFTPAKSGLPAGMLMPLPSSICVKDVNDQATLSIIKPISLIRTKAIQTSH